MTSKLVWKFHSITRKVIEIIQNSCNLQFFEDIPIYHISMCFSLRNMKLEYLALKNKEHLVKFLMCKILISKYNAQNPTGNVFFLTS